MECRAQAQDQGPDLREPEVFHLARRVTAEYMQAVTDVAQATVDGADPGQIFRLIVHQARNLIGAASSTIGTLGPELTNLTIRAADGAHAERLPVGATIPVEGT